MARKSIMVKPKKRGRPPMGGRDPLVGTRMPRALIQELDAWATHNTEGSRSEAIRRLVEQALTTAASHQPTSKATARKAADLAGREINQLGDPSATREERASRKRRLISGPKEFRDMRGDHSTSKRSK
jgi:hypothetical protein